MPGPAPHTGKLGPEITGASRKIISISVGRQSWPAGASTRRKRPRAPTRHAGTPVSPRFRRAWPAQTRMCTPYLHPAKVQRAVGWAGPRRRGLP